MAESHVGGAYVGLWKRALLETPALRDTTSRVFLLQTRDWHADIRISPDRPDLSGAGALRELDRTALLALTRQQGCGRRLGTRSWRIDLWTLPWREGELVSLRAG